MALIASLGALGCVAVFGLLFAALGRSLLRWADLPSWSPLEDLLLSTAAGVIVFEVAVAIVSYTSRFRSAIGMLLALLAIAALPKLPGTLRDLLAIWRARTFSPLERVLAVTVFVVLLVDGLSAVAPLTGSDALHYHFTTARLYIENGFHPIFSIVHSFLIGQSHGLIITGLALGSEKLALGLLYLGGLLTGAACALVARRLSSCIGGWTAALTFLVTPIIFWQMTVAGAPDVWMAFFTTMAVLCVARVRERPSMSFVFWIGMLGGAVAGAKYSGCIVAVAIALALVCEIRSARALSIVVCGMLCSGIWPYLRNFFWTRDPFFPFGMRVFAPDRLNIFTLTSLVADTGTNEHASLLKIPLFATFAQFDPLRPGFFQYFGPLCLALLPLMLLSIKNKPLWRSILIVWLAASVGLAASSGLTRFFIPVFPIALSALIASACLIKEDSVRVIRYIAMASIAIVILMGLGGLLIYERPALAASIGRIQTDDYLRQRAPDYDRTEFVNETLAASGGSKKVLVFFQHLYYLRVPYIYGDPKASWMIDPQKFQSAQDWINFFNRERVGWVVRSPNYPVQIAAPLQQLENSGELKPIAHGDTSEFVGMRAQGVRTSLPIVILRVESKKK